MENFRKFILSINIEYFWKYWFQTCGDQTSLTASMVLEMLLTPQLWRAEHVLTLTWWSQQFSLTAGISHRALDGPWEGQHALMNTKITTTSTSGKISNWSVMLQWNNGHEPQQQLEKYYLFCLFHAKAEAFSWTESDDVLPGQGGKWKEGFWELWALLSSLLFLWNICPFCPWFHCGSHMASNTPLSSHWELSAVEPCQSPSWFNDMGKSTVQCSPAQGLTRPWCWSWSQQVMLGIEPSVPQTQELTCATPCCIQPLCMAY